MYCKLLFHVFVARVRHNCGCFDEEGCLDQLQECIVSHHQHQVQSFNSFSAEIHFRSCFYLCDSPSTHVFLQLKPGSWTYFFISQHLALAGLGGMNTASLELMVDISFCSIYLVHYN